LQQNDLSLHDNDKLPDLLAVFTLHLCQLLNVTQQQRKSI